MKSPAASTTPPRAWNGAAALWRVADDADHAVALGEQRVHARLLDDHRAGAPRRRLEAADEAREFGSTLCMRGCMCGGSGIGP